MDSVQRCEQQRDAIGTRSAHELRMRHEPMPVVQSSSRRIRDPVYELRARQLIAGPSLYSTVAHRSVADLRKKSDISRRGRRECAIAWISRTSGTFSAAPVQYLEARLYCVEGHLPYSVSLSRPALPSSRSSSLKPPSSSSAHHALHDDCQYRS